MDEKLQLSAYYYSFHATNVLAIDEILSAVARAGKGHHHIKYWADPCGDDKPSYIEKIQQAADEAAQALRAAHRAGMEEAAGVVEDLDDPNCDGGNIYASAIRAAMEKDTSEKGAGEESHLGPLCKFDRHMWHTTEHGHDICVQCKTTRPTPEPTDAGRAALGEDTKT